MNQPIQPFTLKYEQPLEQGKPNYLGNKTYPPNNDSSIQNHIAFLLERQTQHQVTTNILLNRVEELLKKGITISTK